MSRLDSMIRRMSAQRACLNQAAMRAPPGFFLEIGLGNGRTYHHLREIAPERDIWVIDREMNAHPSSIPPENRFLQGEAEQMLEALFESAGRAVAMAHYDLGVGVEAQDAPLARLLAPALARLMLSGGLLVANRRFEAFEALPPPPDVAEDRYFLHRVM